jgi:hypothetical protein
MAQPATITVEPIVRDLSTSPQQFALTPPTYPFVPEPGQDLISLQASVKRLKEGYEMMTGQRGPSEYSLVEGMLSISKKTANSIARIIEINEVQATTTSALVAWTKILEADLYTGPDNWTGRITEVERVVLTPTSGLVSKVETLELQMNTPVSGVTAQIQNLNKIVITGDPVNGITALVTRTEKLELQMNFPGTNGSELYASVTNEAFIRSQSDIGLDGRINTVEAGWGVKVVLNNTSGFMTILGVLKNDGTVTFGIEWQANTFRMLDPTNGQAKQIFFYEAGKFRFTGDVTIDGKLIVLGSVDYPQIAPNSATQGVVATGVNAASVGIVTRGGKVVLIAGFEATEDVLEFVSKTNIDPPLPTVKHASLYRGSGVLKTIKMSTDVYFNYSGMHANSNGAVSFTSSMVVYANPTTTIFEDAPGAGAWSYAWTGDIPGIYTLEAIELLR